MPEIIRKNQEIWELGYAAGNACKCKEYYICDCVIDEMNLGINRKVVEIMCTYDRAMQFSVLFYRACLRSRSRTCTHHVKHFVPPP